MGSTGPQGQRYCVLCTLNLEMANEG